MRRWPDSMPINDYSLGRDRDERTCLVETDEGWVVYYTERGRRESLKLFSSLAIASKHLIELLHP